MRTQLAGLGLALAAGAAAVAGYVLVRERTTSADVQAQLERLDARFDRLERTIAERRRDETPGPTLLGLPADRTPGPESSGGVARPAPAGRERTALEAIDSSDAPASAAEIEDLVHDVVEKKAAQLHLMATNKKPSIDVFAKTLALTDEQRRLAEGAVLKSQHEIRDILEIPTDDGAVFMDNLVEVMARGLARPEDKGANASRWQKLFGRLLTEEVPGTSETYADRVEGVKERLRDTFRRDWSEEQYETFETWQMDPSEVQEVPGSPWKEIEGRVIERAKDLGAEIPADDR